MKVLEVEVTGKDGVIHISQPDVYGDGCDEVYITTEQLLLFKMMLDEAAREADKE